MKNLPLDLQLLIMKHLCANDVRSLSEASTEHHQQYSNYFFAKRCLERNVGISSISMIERRGNRAFSHFREETTRETEALEATGLRPSYPL